MKIKYGMTLFVALMLTLTGVTYLETMPSESEIEEDVAVEVFKFNDWMEDKKSEKYATTPKD